MSILKDPNKKNFKNRKSNNPVKNAHNEEKKINILEHYLNENLPNKKPKTKINDDDFSMPNFENYENILDINYNLQQFKTICKFYKIKLTGNKNELKKRCHNFLYFSYYARIIQKFVRKLNITNYIYYHGPGFHNRTNCVNDVDFCTLDNINKIPYTQFFSFKDEENFIYGFDILSIYNLYIKNKTQIENPFTKKLINKSVFINMMRFIKYSKIIGININIDYDTIHKLSDSKQLDMKILTLFQNMDSLGNYTNLSWFNSLNKNELIRFIRELLDIWNYRANLSQETKREICPPLGNPFRVLNINVNMINSYSFIQIKKNIVNVLDEFINKGITNDSKSLGCFYILSALTLVNYNAAEAMPWLYESVTYEPG